jgi:hypothetical protein
MSIEAVLTQFEVVAKNLPGGMKKPTKALRNSFSAPGIETVCS